jgi:hypothetical protein
MGEVENLKSLIILIQATILVSSFRIRQSRRGDLPSQARYNVDGGPHGGSYDVERESAFPAFPHFPLASI